MLRIRANHVARAETLDLVCEGGTIQSLAAPEGAPPELQAAYMAPAFFDLQINGGHGHNFSSVSLTVAEVRAVVKTCREHGIGAFFPTLITNSHEALRHGLSVLRQAVESDPGLERALPGIHLEGPYIAAEDGPRGAHPRQHVRPPDWDEFRRLQEAAGGRIRLVTLAPEQDGALAFIERLVQHGIVVAIGHTAATGPRIREAIAAGARLSTHLGNGSHAQLPRHENYVWEQLAADELWASLITDGHHLPPNLIRCFFRIKTPARLILTCDASSLAGLPPGRYREWEQDIDVLPSGKIVVPQFGVLAGSWAFTDLCVGMAVRHGGVTLPEAVALVTDQPRRLLGLPERRLEPGMPADLVLFDLDDQGQVRVRYTILAGEVVFAAERDRL
jgi:N-acetylglucosamine-6-phosphate deacetylase